MIHSAFSLPQDCADLKLVKLILTNTRLIILTTLGLFISEDLRYVTAQPLQVRKYASE